jgi:hypothetical protein
MIQATDRYDGFGIPRPDPDTVCQGQCEGTGVVPVFVYEGESAVDYPVKTTSETDPALLLAWHEAEKENRTDDGYHFVTCPECTGSGVRP